MLSLALLVVCLLLEGLSWVKNHPCGIQRRLDFVMVSLFFSALFLKAFGY